MQNAKTPPAARLALAAGLRLTCHVVRFHLLTACALSVSPQLVTRFVIGDLNAKARQNTALSLFQPSYPPPNHRPTHKTKTSTSLPPPPPPSFPQDALGRLYNEDERQRIILRLDEEAQTHGDIVRIRQRDAPGADTDRTVHERARARAERADRARATRAARVAGFSATRCSQCGTLAHAPKRCRQACRALCLQMQTALTVQHELRHLSLCRDGVAARAEDVRGSDALHRRRVVCQGECKNGPLRILGATRILPNPRTPAPFLFRAFFAPCVCF